MSDVMLDVISDVISDVMSDVMSDVTSDVMSEGGKLIYKYLESTNFLLRNIIYKLHIFTTSDLQSKMKIMTNYTIYNLTSCQMPYQMS